MRKYSVVKMLTVIVSCLLFAALSQGALLTVTESGTGSGIVTSVPFGIVCGVTCSSGYSNGTSVTLTETTGTGSTFTGWSGACSTQSVSPACVVTMNAAEAVTAHFLITGTSSFSDVPSTDPYESYIESIYNNGITTGCGNGDYCPLENVTRDQMAAFIIRALYGNTFTCNGGVACATTAPYFGDVSTADQFFPYVQKLKELGITTGCGNGNYCPSEYVARDQMAAFLVRAAQVNAGQAPENFTCTGGMGGEPLPCTSILIPPYFTDVQSVTADQFYPYIQKLSELKITIGCGSGKYCPSEDVTRDQMAVFLGRAFLGMP